MNITGLIGSGTSAWNKLKTEAQDWAKKVVTLYNTPVPPELSADKNKLLNTAKTIKKSIEGIYGGLTDLNSIGLGAIPILIPAAVIVGAAAAITKWTYDYNIFKDKLSEYQKMVASGVPERDAAKTVDMISQSASSKSAFNTALKVLPFALGGFLLIKFMEMRRN